MLLSSQAKNYSGGSSKNAVAVRDFSFFNTWSFLYHSLWLPGAYNNIVPAFTILDLHSCHLIITTTFVSYSC